MHQPALNADDSDSTVVSSGLALGGTRPRSLGRRVLTVESGRGVPGLEVFGVPHGVADQLGGAHGVQGIESTEVI